MKDFVTIDNVPFDWVERLHELDNYTLFVSDCFWMLKTKDFCEFYYNPCRYMGKIAVSEIPDYVLHRIARISVVFKKEEVDYRYQLQDPLSLPLRPSSIRFRQIERDMRIGNWFRAQGQNYATWKGRFIRDDMYVEGRERECSIHDINGGVVYDMIRMSCQSRTPNYIKSVFDLSVFAGVDVSKMTILPYEDVEWNASQWIKEFDVCSEYVVKYNHASDMQKIRNLRAEVFQHTVAVVKKGYYTLEGKKYVLASEDVLSMIENTCYYDKSFDVNAYPSFEGGNNDCR